MEITITKDETRCFIPVKEIESSNPPMDCGFALIRSTDRNWRGHTYIPKSEVQSFFDALQKVYESHSHIFKDMSTTPVSFLVDTSVFSKNHESNDKLLDFIDELSIVSNHPKTERKKKSKLHFFASKPEHFGYLFYWATQHPTHPLALECLMHIDEAMNRFRASFENKYDLSKAQDDKVFSSFNATEEASIGKLMKYSYVSPVHFLYNAYFVYKWFGFYQPAMELMSTKFLVTQFVDDKKVVTDVYQGSSFPESAYIFQSLMGHFMGLISHENFGWATGNLWHLDQHPENEEIFRKHGINEELLKSVANWAVKKIKEERKFSLPSKDWYTDVDWAFLKELGITEMTFIDEKVVAGKDGEELLIHGKLHAGEAEYVIFPLISPKNWDGISLLTKAIMTYSFCLYHDITVENAFSLIEDEEATFIPLPLYGIPERLVFSGKKMFSKAKSENGAKREHSTHRKPKEHWVTFHFRKLKEGYEASEEATDKANQYGIHIPKGYTFIDSHIRGKETAELGVKPKVSALDIFSKLFMK